VIEDQIETFAWVERAQVTTDFPHRVTIDIRERIPIATFAGSDGRYRVIDRDSRVLDVIGGIPLAPMLITGTHPDTDVGLFAGPAYAAAAQLVIALPAEIRVITTSVGIDPATADLSLQLDGGVVVRLGAANDLPVKLARLLQRVRAGLDGVEQVDVSTDAVGS
jgi:cell division septal protein FtsQ